MQAMQLGYNRQYSHEVAVMISFEMLCLDHNRKVNKSYVLSHNIKLSRKVEQGVVLPAKSFSN